MSENTLKTYLKYLTANIILVNDWIDKFGIQDDKVILDCVSNLTEDVNCIMNRMIELGIEVDELTNESYNIEKHCRDFKLKKLLEDERD